MVIRKKPNEQYCIEKKYTFATVKELVDFYANPNNRTEMKVFLKTPILQQYWEYKYSDLDMTGGRKLGRGAYGYVMSGKLNLGKRLFGGIVNVAVKVQNPTNDTRQRRERRR